MRFGPPTTEERRADDAQRIRDAIKAAGAQPTDQANQEAIEELKKQFPAADGKIR